MTCLTEKKLEPIVLFLRIHNTFLTISFRHLLEKIFTLYIFENNFMRETNVSENTQYLFDNIFQTSFGEDFYTVYF